MELLFLEVQLLFPDAQLLFLGCTVSVPLMLSFCSSDAQLLFLGWEITVPRMRFFVPEMLTEKKEKI